MRGLRRIRYFFARDRAARELEEEMRLHLELRAASLEESGISAADARLAARRRFGNPTIMEERSRDMWGYAAIDQLRQDLRFAARRLRQRPGFSVPIIAVLALGIGATTAVFSAIDAAMLRPLPFARSNELVTVTRASVPFNDPSVEREVEAARYLDITDVVAMNDVFSRAAAYASGGVNLDDPDSPQRLNVGVVTHEFFSTLGVPPGQGRAFSAEEGVPNGPAVVVLSHALWRRQYGERDMLGRSILLDGKPYTVIGVMRQGFSFPNESDLWIPMSVPTTFATFGPFRGFLPSFVVARLVPGVPLETASARLLARWQQLAGPRAEDERSGMHEVIATVRERGAAVPLQRQLLGDRRKALWVLLGATGLLLLIACANVANLLLSDAAIRRREIAVREVLGASRRRVVRQLLVESVLLSLAGAAVGIALAPVLLGALRALLPASLAGLAPAQLDLRVLAFASGLAFLTGIVFGLWPAIGATREDPGATIKSGGGHGATAGKLGLTRRALVVAEIALTVMLLIGAGLMLRSFDRLMSEDLGMNPERLATVEMSFGRSSGGRTETLRTIHAILDRLAAHPGVAAVGAVNDLPLRGGGGIRLSIQVDGAPEARTPEERLVRMGRYLLASGGYFSTMGIPLLRGRVFTAADDSLAPPVAIVSSKMASAWWPGVDPIGRTFRLLHPEPYTVVGVVGDVRETRLDLDPYPGFYLPIDIQTPSSVAIVARGTLPPAVLLAQLREAVRHAAPAQPVYNLRMMDQVIGASVAPRRTNTILISLFAGLALVLAALGVYAVMAYGVAQRSREFGIRAALGATGRDLVGLVAREMVVVLAVGLALGLGAAWAASRVLASLLYGVDARDAVTFALVPLVLLVPAALATLIPARRATRVNPTDVMRTD